MAKQGGLEELQSLNKTMFEELGEHTQDYLNTLKDWLANPRDEELQAKLEAQALGLRIHVEVMEGGSRRNRTYCRKINGTKCLEEVMVRTSEESFFFEKTKTYTSTTNLAIGKTT